jgi:hypothetical protein
MALIKTLARELHALQLQPPEGIRVLVNEHNLAGRQGGRALGKMRRQLLLIKELHL